MPLKKGGKHDNSVTVNIRNYGCINIYVTNYWCNLVKSGITVCGAVSTIGHSAYMGNSEGRIRKKEMNDRGGYYIYSSLKFLEDLMATINEMRTAILNRYPGASMGFREMIATGPTRRVVAIYSDLLKKGKLEGRGETCTHQIDMFEYMASLNEKGNTTNIKVEG